MALSLQERKLVQRTINETMELDLKPDGALGPLSIKGIIKYQTQNGLNATGEVDAPTWNMMSTYIDARFVTVKQVANSAVRAGMSPAVLLALWEVESVGEGFLTDGRCVILFERHKFYQYAKARLGVGVAEGWRKKTPDLCHPLWDASFYAGGKAEWNRLTKASALDATCALLATSWGLFQTMGFNHALMGYDDVQSMVAAYKESEIYQLEAVVRFIEAQPRMHLAAKNKNFTELARLYNGASYAKHNYHGRLKAAHDKWAKVIF